MNRLLYLASFLFIASFSGYAQSAITVGLDGGQAIFAGVQFKYTYSFKKIQLGAFVTPTYYDHDYITRLGICINSVPIKKKDASLYYGFAVEGFSEHGSGYTDKAIMAGLHLGVNVKLKERLYFNSEWGYRQGVLFTEKYNQSPGAYSNGWGGTYSESRENIFYFPASLGITYVFSKKER